MSRAFAVAALVLVTLAGLPGLVGAADDVDAVLERTRAVYGGESLPAPGTLSRSSGRILSTGRSLGGTVLREAVWPDYMKIEIDFEDGTRETRLMLGDEGWRDGAPASGPLIQAMRLQAARLSLPMILWWERDSLDDLGVATREDGLAVRRLRVAIDEELALFVEIDARTGQILRSAGVMQMGGAEMTFGAVYSDFRDFGDLTWPAHEDQSAMGRAIGWTEIDKLETGLPFHRDSVRP